MTTKKKDAVSVPSEAPAYLTQHGGEGTETMPVSSSTPRLKLIQGMTDKALKKEHGEGALVLMPDEILVAAADEAVTVAPLFRWVSWQAWGDLDDNSLERPIMGETTDPDNEIATKAKDRVVEPYPDGRINAKGDPMEVRYVEAINYIVRLESGPCEGAVCAYSWVRANHKHGANLSRYIDRMGAKDGVPIYGNRVDLTPGDETNKRGQTYQVVRAAPAGDPFAAEEAVPALQELHREFAKMHNASTSGQ